MTAQDSGFSSPASVSIRRLINNDLLFGTALAFVAGFVDAFGFVAVFGLFTSHVTGNFVMLGSELVTSSNGVIAKLLALPVFILAVAGTRLFAVALEKRQAAPPRPLFLLQMIFLAAFLASGIVLSPLTGADAPGAILVGMLGVAAMGVQNAIGRLSLPHLAATTVMTVNVTQAVIDGVDLLRSGAPKAREQAASRLQRMLPAIVAFAIGAVIGPFGMVLWSFWSLAIPIVVLALLVLLASGEPRD